MKHFLIGVIAMTTICMSCKKDNAVTPDFFHQMIQIGQQSLADGSVVHVYATDTLTTGYNQIFFQIMKDGTPRQANPVAISTLMDMGSMKHSSPCTDPVFVAAKQAYEAGAVFTMPSTSKEWTLILKIGDESVIFPLDVRASASKTVGSFSGSDGNTYVIAIIFDKKYRVGLNEFSLFISRKDSPMSFLPVSGLTVAFYPEMTSMGHSSPNNIDPIDATHGFYNGTANFTMSGDWRLHFKLKNGSEVLIDDTFFDIVF